MKRLLLLLLALAALMAAMSSGASATVLCKTATNPCNSVYPAETKIELELVSPLSLFEFTNGTEFNWCAEESLSASIANPGGLFSPVVAPVGKWEFSECEGFAKTIHGGKAFEVSHISGTHNGMASVSEVEWTFLNPFLGLYCKFGLKNVPLGTLVGGSDPVLKVAINIPRVDAPPCYDDIIRWTASFTVKAPSPVYVEPA